MCTNWKFFILFSIIYSTCQDVHLFQFHTIYKYLRSWHTDCAWFRYIRILLTCVYFIICYYIYRAAPGGRNLKLILCWKTSKCQKLFKSTLPPASPVSKSVNGGLVRPFWTHWYESWLYRYIILYMVTIGHKIFIKQASLSFLWYSDIRTVYHDLFLWPFFPIDHNISLWCLWWAPAPYVTLIVSLSGW